MTHGRWRSFLAPVPALAALAIVAALAPARVKLFGLFPAAVGAAAGALVIALVAWKPSARRSGLMAAAVLVPMTLTAYAAGSYYVWRQARAQELTANLLAQPGGKALLDRIHSGKTPTDPVMAEMLVVYREYLSPPLSDYLKSRLKGLPGPKLIPMPWAAVFAGGEFLFGWAAGMGVAVAAERRGDRRLDGSRGADEETTLRRPLRAEDSG